MCRNVYRSYYGSCVSAPVLREESQSVGRRAVVFTFTAERACNRARLVKLERGGTSRSPRVCLRVPRTRSNDPFGSRGVEQSLRRCGLIHVLTPRNTADKAVLIKVGKSSCALQDNPSKGIWNITTRYARDCKLYRENEHTWFIEAL